MSLFTTKQLDMLIKIVGGQEAAMALINGEKRVVLTDVGVPLVGTVVKTLRLRPYVISWADYVWDYFDGVDEDIRRIFGTGVGLAEEVSVDLVSFERDVRAHEVLAWEKAQGRESINDIMLFAIGMQHDYGKATIVEVGTVREGKLLFLSSWRDDLALLNHSSVRMLWPKGTLFGMKTKK